MSEKSISFYHVRYPLIEMKHSAPVEKSCNISLSQDFVDKFSSTYHALELLFTLGNAEHIQRTVKRKRIRS